MERTLPTNFNTLEINFLFPAVLFLLIRQYGPTGGISYEASDLNSISYGIWNHVAFSQNSSRWLVMQEFQICISGRVVSSGNEVERFTQLPFTRLEYIDDRSVRRQLLQEQYGGRKYEVGNPSGFNSLFQGFIDDVRIYDRTFSVGLQHCTKLRGPLTMEQLQIVSARKLRAIR